MVSAAFEQLNVAYLERFRTPVLGAARSPRFAVGHIDCYNHPVRVLGYASQHWLRSCFLLLASAEARLLGSCVSAPRRELWFSGPESPFAADAPVDETYRKYIADWLPGEDVGQTVT